MIARAVLLCVLLMTIPPVSAGEYQDDPAIIAIRSEERRVGKECI